MEKIYSREELKKIIDRLRKEGKKIIFTNGCFDILHVGHTRYLEEAKKQGDVLVLGLNSDDSVRSIKGQKRPVIPENERADVVAALESVDYVTIFPELTPLELIEYLKPDVTCERRRLERGTGSGSKITRKMGWQGNHHSRNQRILNNECY